MANARDRGSTQHFGPFVFDRASEELSQAGRRIPLQPQPARLLGLFLSRPGELLTREAIREHLWPENFVEFEQRISSLVRTLRITLGDDRADPRYIQTVSRKGYRFIGLEGQSTPWFRRDFRWAAAGTAALIVLVIGSLVVQQPDAQEAGDQRRIVLAVLPVEELDPDAENPFPVNVLTEELISRAARIAPGRLGVIARTSVMGFKETDRTAREITEALGADFLLEVGLRHRDETVRVSATLIDGPSNQTVWSESYDVPLGDLLALENDIARRVAEALEIEILDPSHRATESRPPVHPEAYRLYVEGLFLSGRGNMADVLESMAFFEASIRLDSTFAPAFVGLARLASALGRPSNEVDPALERAILLDPGQADAYWLRGQRRLYMKWDLAGARSDLEKAVDLEPERARFRLAYANLLGILREFDGAIHEARFAQSLDPLSGVANGDLGWLFVAAERFAEATDQCRLTLNLIPDHFFARLCLIHALAGLGDMTGAATIALEAAEANGMPPDKAESLKEGTPSEAIQAYRLWTLFQLTTASSTPNHLATAMAYAELGQTENALQSLRRSVLAREGSLVFIGMDPRLKTLRSDPRFMEITRTIGLPTALVHGSEPRKDPPSPREREHSTR